MFKGIPFMSFTKNFGLVKKIIMILEKEIVLFLCVKNNNNFFPPFLFERAIMNNGLCRIFQYWSAKISILYKNKMANDANDL